MDISIEVEWEKNGEIFASWENVDIRMQEKRFNYHLKVKLRFRFKLISPTPS